MVWQFIGVNVINRILHGRLEIRNFSSRVEKIFHSFAALNSKRNFISPRCHVISSIYKPEGLVTYEILTWNLPFTSWPDIAIIKQFVCRCWDLWNHKLHKVVYCQLYIVKSCAFARVTDQTNHRSRSLCKLGRVSGADTKGGETFH